jgi:hypothetical protein
MALLLKLVPMLAGLTSLGAASKNGNQMNCGSGVPLCGVLTLQTGLGSGVYHSNASKVHGLWPEVGNYGTSQCIKPKNDAAATKIYECYAEEDHTHALWFENHEWTHHGQCAGVKDVDDFFGQVCSLSKAPLAELEKAKEAGKSFSTMAQALRDQGYPVFALDQENDQIELAACAGSNGRWVLADVSDMQAKCGGSPPAPSPSPTPSPPPPSPHTGACVHNKKGPKCSSDGDCSGLTGCIRCAHSGYCTDQPLLHAANISRLIQV